MKKSLKLPLWLKIFLVLVPLSVVLSVLGAVSPDLIAPVLVFVPVIFPGKNKNKPTMMWILPWLWGLEIAGSLFFLALAFTGKTFGGEDMRQPTIPELVSALILYPPLIWGLVMRDRRFKPLLLLATVVFVALPIWVYSGSLQDGKDRLELASELITQAIVTIYLLIKFRPLSLSEARAEEGQLANEQK